MKNLATAFVELAGYLEIAKFDDPDEAQGAQEVVGRCMINATPEERAAIAGAARQFAREAVVLCLVNWFFIKVIHRLSCGFIDEFHDPRTVFLLIARVQFGIVRNLGGNHSEQDFE
jgi:hypothetical protein